MTSLFLRRIRLACSRLRVMRLVFVDRQVVWLWRMALLWERTLLWPMQICLMLTTTSFMAQAWPLLSSQCSHFAITCQEIDTCLRRKEKEKVISFNCGLDLRWPCCGSTPTIGIWWSQSAVMAAITVMHDEDAGLMLCEWHLQGYDHTQCCCSKCHSGVCSAISELYSCKKTDIAGGNRAFNSRVLTERTCFLSAGTSSNRWSKKLLQYNYRWEHYS